MRQIKFRVWDIQNKNFVKDSLLENINSYFTAADGTINWFRNDNEYVIQQFTGLKDANGVDIYEGDIILETWGENQPYGDPDKWYNKTSKFVVEYKAPSFNFPEPYQRSNDNYELKVIGNIFEGEKEEKDYLEDLLSRLMMEVRATEYIRTKTMTLDELLETVPPQVKEAIVEICEKAGTYDADWEVLKAAGELLVKYKKE